MKALTQNTLAVVLALLTFASCQKQEPEATQFDNQESNSEIRDMMQEMQQASMSLQTAQAASNKVATPECLQQEEYPICAEVNVIDNGGGSETLVIDYGRGCDADGELKMGKITIITKSEPASPDFSMTTVYEDFYLDGKTYNGRTVLSNITAEGDAYPNFEETKSVTFTHTKNGNLVTGTTTGQFYIEWREGMNARECNQNIFAYSGKRVRAMEVNGKSWSVSTEYLEPAVLNESCGYFLEGVLQVYKSHSGKTFTWDFGDGSCDNLADLDINGRSFQVAMEAPKLL